MEVEQNKLHLQIEAYYVETKKLLAIVLATGTLKGSIIGPLCAKMGVCSV